ncbi:hypothetical protein EXIGLDRAFT_747485 [Exidia glandulosa HHB12029]|uniref:Ig-like domain-containing protein n=1 Tax=Exidia glandulosa HHB12029 TaxID=1314781 RepID=A0A165KQB7_EXIGL|nr:hypothetical protein EXIGLDRAFT_747485 [Exidia glandulosa HHB12029]
MFSLTVARILATTMLFSIASASPLATNTTPSLVKRSPQSGTGPCGLPTTITQLDGDGAPSDTTLYKQISHPLACADAQSCTVVHTESESFTIGATLGGAFEWIDGGFDVSESVETGEADECSAVTGQIVCVFSVLPHKRYNVVDRPESPCLGGVGEIQGHYVMTSPINNAKSFRCGLGDQCHDIGTETWDVLP